MEQTDRETKWDCHTTEDGKVIVLDVLEVKIFEIPISSNIRESQQSGKKHRSGMLKLISLVDHIYKERVFLDNIHIGWDSPQWVFYVGQELASWYCSDIFLSCFGFIVILQCLAYQAVGT